MKYLAATAGALMFGTLLAYLYLNVTSEESGGVAYPLLVCALAFGALAMGLIQAQLERIVLRRSLFVLMLFLGYLTLRLVLDVQDPKVVQEDTLGTDGGVVLAYLLGAFCHAGAISICRLADSSRSKNVVAVTGVLLIISLNVVLLLIAVISAQANLRSDILLLNDEAASYQRRGNFLTIAYLVISVLVMAIHVVGVRHGGHVKRTMLFLIRLLYLLSVPLVCYFSQVIGSNSAVLCVVSAAAVTGAFMFAVTGSDIWKGRVSEVFELRVVMKKFMLMASLLALTFALFVAVSGVDVSKTRLLNFGSSGSVSSSITARITIVRDNYLMQLNVSPFFGNAAADRITTGEGTYAHSFILALFSHCGILGASLFLCYFYFSIQEAVNPRRNIGPGAPDTYLQSLFKTYMVSMALVFFSIACISTFITWMPIWVALGLLLPPVVLPVNREGIR